MKLAQELKAFKRQMRKKPTKSERIFALRLKESGIEFKRQIIIGFYIVDFCLPNALAVIEIDGESHLQQKEYDAERDEFLRKSGFKVIRIKNSEAETYPVHPLTQLHQYPFQHFLDALGMANILKGYAMKNAPMRLARKVMRPLF